MTINYRYNIEDYERILKTVDIKKIDTNVLQILNELNKIIQNNDIDFKKEYYKKDRERSNFKYKKFNSNYPYTSEKNNFHKTKIVKGEFNLNIRNILNKITIKNYDAQKNELCKILEIIKNNNDENKEVYIYDTIIDIIKNNIYFSEIYAKLYRDLIECSNYLYEKIIDEGKKMSDYLLETNNNNNDNIDNNNYSELCLQNKKNDERRSLLSFFVYLFKDDAININILINILNNLLDAIEKNLNNDKKRNKNEELSELISIILLNLSTSNIFMENKNKYLTKIKEITEYNPKKYMGISNKIIFKLMDILDKY